MVNKNILKLYIYIYNMYLNMNNLGKSTKILNGLNEKIYNEFIYKYTLTQQNNKIIQKVKYLIII